MLTCYMSGSVSVPVTVPTVATTMGGYRDEKVDDAHVQQAARVVADHYNRVHNSDKRFIVTAVHKGESSWCSALLPVARCGIGAHAGAFNCNTWLGLGVQLVSRWWLVSSTTCSST